MAKLSAKYEVLYIIDPRRVKRVSRLSWKNSRVSWRLTAL